MIQWKTFRRERGMLATESVDYDLRFAKMCIRPLLLILCLVSANDALAQGSDKRRVVPPGRDDSAPPRTEDPTAMLLRAELARLGTLVRNRVKGVEVTPDTVRLEPGGKLSIASLRVTARDAKGDIVQGVAPRWSLTRSPAATFQGDTVIALKAGKAVLNVEPVGRPESDVKTDWPTARVIIIVERARPKP